MALALRSPKSPKVASPTDIRIGRMVRALRLERGKSQTDLGDRLGITFQQVQKYEKGTNRIPSGRLEQIAAFFGIEPAYFFSTNGGSPRRDATRIDEFMADFHGAQLAVAYLAIADHRIRRGIVELVKRIAVARKK